MSAVARANGHADESGISIMPGAKRLCLTWRHGT